LPDHGGQFRWNCKTSIRRFESARRLHIANELDEVPAKSGAFSRLTADMTATGNVLS